MGLIILGLLPIIALYLLIFQPKFLFGAIGILIGIGLAWAAGMGILMALFSWLGSA